MFRIDKRFVSYTQPSIYEPEKPEEPSEEKSSLSDNISPKEEAPPEEPEEDPVSQQEQKAKEEEDKERLRKRDRIEELMRITEEERERAIIEAAETINRANAQAEQIIKEAKLEAERLKDSAYKDGCDAAAVQLSKERDALMESISQRENELISQQQDDAAMVGRLIAEIGDKRDALFDRMEDELLDFCLSLAKKVVNMAIENENPVYEAMCIKAIRQLKWNGSITLKVSTSEYKRFFADGKAAFIIGDESVTATVEEDDFLNPGDLIVETDSETIDAGVDTQFKHLEISFHDLEK